MQLRPRVLQVAIVGGLVAAMASQTANAQLTLTAAGVARGFTLSTFVSEVPNNGAVGPLGFGFNGDGTVLVSDYTGNVRVLPSHADNQIATAGQVAQNYGGANAVDMRQLGSNIYMTQQGAGNVIQVNANGTFNQTIIGGGALPGATGMVADPTNNRLFVGAIGLNGIYIVDPVAKTQSLFKSGGFDGLTLEADGSVLYASGFDGHIHGYRTSDGVQVFDSGLIPGGIDGTVLGAGLFAGYIYSNANNGTLIEINMNTLAQTVVAHLGSRGDFMNIDPFDGSLLITQTDRVIRLRGLQVQHPGVPEPGTLALLVGFGGTAMVAVRRRRSK